MMKKVKKMAQRQVSLHDVADYEAQGYKKVKNVGQSSAIVQKEIEVEVEVPETELEKLDRQIEELQERRKLLVADEKAEGEEKGPKGKKRKA